MRPIKYRVPMFSYDGKFSHFSYWGRIDHTGSLVFNGECFTSPGQSNKHTPGDDEQFTGSLDKNGKEIYEGDICKIVHDELGSPIDCGFCGMVIFAESSFLVDSGSDYIPLSQEIAEWEVIGNIHESPELIPPGV